MTVLADPLSEQTRAVAQMLRNRAINQRGRQICVGLCGIGVTLFAPMLAAGIVVQLLARAGLVFSWAIPLIASIVIAAALAFVHIRRVKLEQWFELPVREGERRGREYTVLRTTVRYPWWAEAMVVGPRMAVNSFVAEIAAAEIGPINGPQTAELMLRLCRSDGPVAIDNLRRQAADPVEMTRMLAFLHAYRFVGIDDERTQAWVVPEVRENISRMLLS